MRGRFFFDPIPVTLLGLNDHYNGRSTVTPYRSLYSVLTVILTVGVTWRIPVAVLLGPFGQCNCQGKVTHTSYFSRLFMLLYVGLCWSDNLTVLVRSHFKSSVPVTVWPVTVQFYADIFWLWHTVCSTLQNTTTYYNCSPVLCGHLRTLTCAHLAAAL